jgi:uncharacterized phiE125 gp8 family phage protein
VIFSQATITPPSVEPVTVDEVRLAAHVDFDEEDSILSSWIVTARELAEAYQHRAYITQTLEVRYDRWPGFPVFLPGSPLQSVVSVNYYGTDDTEYTLDSGSYSVDTASIPGRVGLKYAVTLPTTALRPMSAVAVRYVAGYGDDASATPEAVKDAIKLYCTWRYENRAAEAGAVPRTFYDLLYTRRVFD